MQQMLSLGYHELARITHSQLHPSPVQLCTQGTEIFDLNNISSREGIPVQSSEIEIRDGVWKEEGGC